MTFGREFRDSDVFLFPAFIGGPMFIMFGYLLITDLQRIYGLLLTEPAGFNDVRWGAAYQIIRITIAASLLSGIIGRALSQRLRKMRLVPWTFHLLYIACAVDVL